MSCKEGIFRGVLEEELRRKKETKSLTFSADWQQTIVPALFFRAYASGTVASLLCQTNRTYEKSRVAGMHPQLQEWNNFLALPGNIEKAISKMATY